MVTILGLSASPRDAATAAAVRVALEEAGKIQDVQTRFISLKNRDIRNCTHCNYCFRNKAPCIIEDDMRELTEAFLAADGYIMASPVYTMSVTPQLLTFFNRLRPLRYLRPKGLFGKVGGAITIGGTRNGGQEIALSTIMNCFLSRGIVVVGGSTGHYAGAKVWSKDDGERGVHADEIGLSAVRDIGIRVAYMALAMQSGSSAIGAYETYTAVR